LINLTTTGGDYLAGTNVRVNAICPGIIETGMTSRSSTTPSSAHAGQDRPAQSASSGSASERDRLHGAVLASDEASYVNGQHIAVDGGLTSSMPVTGPHRSLACVADALSGAGRQAQASVRSIGREAMGRMQGKVAICPPGAASGIGRASDFCSRRRGPPSSRFDRAKDVEDTGPRLEKPVAARLRSPPMPHPRKTSHSRRHGGQGVRRAPDAIYATRRDRHLKVVPRASKEDWSDVNRRQCLRRPISRSRMPPV